MKRFACFSVVILCLFMSCSHVKEQQKTTKAVVPVEIPSPVMPQIESAKRIEIEGPKELFSFSLREADVKDVLRAIAKQTNYNVVIEPDVKGLCTVDLKNVTLPKALEYILEPLNYTFKLDGRTVYVSKPKLETRVFPLNYIAMKKIGVSTITGKTGSDRTGSSSGTSGTSTSGSSSGSGAQVAVDMKSETETDLWTNVEDNIKNLISPEGKYAINKLASLVVVIDYPKYLKNIALFLEAIEGTVQRQVMIEAKIVEVELSEEAQDGINWAVIGAKWGSLNFNLEQALVKTQTTYFNIPQVTTMPTAPDQYFRFGVSSGKFDAYIDLLKTQGKLNIISSPKIATLNNQRAVIKVAQEDVYFEITSTQVQGAGTQGGVTPKFITVGLILDVTPQIDNYGNIVMNIHPVLTEKVKNVEMPSTGSQAASSTAATVPVLSVREVDTLVKVREGESIIIGGLIKDKIISDQVGVKGLMNIPILGGFFRSEKMQSVKTELVIFLSPKVIYGKDRT